MVKPDLTDDRPKREEEQRVRGVWELNPTHLGAD